MQILITTLRHTEVPNLVGDLVRDFNDGLVRKEILGLIKEFLVYRIHLRINLVVLHQVFQLGEKGISHDGEYHLNDKGNAIWVQTLLDFAQGEYDANRWVPVDEAY